jgi:outer membrane protein TolC
MRSKLSLDQFKSPMRLSLMALACVAAVGCANVQPVALAPQDMQPQIQKDNESIRKDVEPIAGPLTLDEAMARALKYNLDRRAKMMEEALAMGQLDVTKFDMLPKIMAQAGYANRDRARFTYSSQYPNENPVITPTPATTSDRTHSNYDLGLTWSLLDIGMGYYGSKQQADRFLVAGEKRRKAMHLLMQDVRTAYWRAASAQLLKADVEKTIDLAEGALVDSRKVASERVRNPLEPLRYQRQLLENLRLLESINHELSSAQIDLAALINAPLGKPIQIATTDLRNISDEVGKVPVAKLEEVALQNNADLREHHYNSRIAQEETRRTLLRMFPNLSFNYGTKYDTDRYLLSNNWNEAGVQLSFNLMNLFTGATQMKMAEAGVAVADQRRVAAQMSVLTQVHLSRLQVINARSQYDRADAIYDADSKITEVMRNRQSVQAQSKLDVVSTETASILSLLRRYQALAQVQVAENRVLATLGLEPQIGSTNETSLKELTEQIAKSKSVWKELNQVGKTAQAMTAPAAVAVTTAVTAPAAVASKW